MLLMQRLLIPSKMHMFGIIATTWTSEADELAGPSSFKYKYKYKFSIVAHFYLCSLLDRCTVLEVLAVRRRMCVCCGSRWGPCVLFINIWDSLTAPCLVYNTAMYTAYGRCSQYGQCMFIHWPVRGLYGPCQSTHHITNSSHEMSWLYDEWAIWRLDCVTSWLCDGLT